MIETFARAGDTVAAIGFAVALLALLLTPTEPEGTFVPAAKWAMIAAVGIFLFLTGTDSVGQTHMGRFGELFEDYVENLEALLALGVVFVMYSAQQYQDVLRAQRALSQNHELMAEIVDEAPSGIMLLDDLGRIVFANATAKQLLDFEEDPISGSVSGPGWVISGSEEAPPNQLPALVQNEPYDRRSIRLDWPNGWFVELRASGRPLADSADRLGGIVVTFEKA